MARRELAALDSNLDRAVRAGPTALGPDKEHGPLSTSPVSYVYEPEYEPVLNVYEP